MAVTDLLGADGTRRARTRAFGVEGALRAFFDLKLKSLGF